MPQTGLHTETTDTLIQSFSNSAEVSPDSISIQDTTTNTQFSIRSIFEGSEILSEKIIPIARIVINEDWVIYHLIILLGLLAWAGLYYPKRFRQVLKGIFSYQNQTMIRREGNIMREQIALVFLLVYFVNFSLLTYLVITRKLNLTLFDLEGFKLFASIFLSVLVLWIFKNLAMVFTGILYKNDLINHVFILNNFIFNSSVGILLLPPLVIAFYYSSAIGIYIGIILWLSLFIFRILRQTIIGFGTVEFSLFNRILYLCTFEIAPFLVVIKLIMNELGK